MTSLGAARPRCRCASYANHHSELLTSAQSSQTAQHTSSRPVTERKRRQLGCCARIVIWGWRPSLARALGATPLYHPACEQSSTRACHRNDPAICASSSQTAQLVDVVVTPIIYCPANPLDSDRSTVVPSCTGLPLSRTLASLPHEYTERSACPASTL
jgi:hypothetical protein